MKLGFTTLGCPGWNIETIIHRAAEYGFDGIDFRGYLGNNNLWETAPFGRQAADTIQMIRNAGLEIPCYSSSISLLVPEEKQEIFLKEADEYIRLCALSDTPYIRVFGGFAKNVSIENRGEAAEYAAAFLEKLCNRSPRVTFLVETHDDWTSSEALALLLSKCGAENTGVIWDIHHPHRRHGESPEESWNTIGHLTRYTHFKDSYEDEEGNHLCPVGKGTIPVKETAELLIEKGYDGYFTLEWEKRWHPEIEEPEEAFPVFVEYMKNIL